MDNPKLFGIVQNGDIYLEDLDLYENLVNELEGKRIQIDLNPLSLSPTEQQRNTYFGIIIRKHMMLSEAFKGWTVQECDDYLGYKFRRGVKFIRRKNSNSQQAVEYIIPLSKLNRKKLSEYIDACIRYLQEELEIEIKINEASK